MKMNYDNIIRQLNKISPEKSSIIKDDGAELKKNQIWTVKNQNPKINTYLFHITEIINNDLVNVNSMFRWTELSGSEDLKLPKSFLGTRAVFSFEITATIAMNELDECIGRLNNDAEEYINNAEKDLLAGLNRPPYNWGKSYLDEYDVRYQYHEKIIEDIEKMQSKIMPNVFEDATSEPIPFPFLIKQNVIAAAGTDVVEDITYLVKGHDGVSIVLSEVDNSNLCNINVYAEGQVSDALAGSVIYDSANNNVATITKNCAEFAKNRITSGFFLRDKNDEAISLFKGE